MELHLWFYINPHQARGAERCTECEPVGPKEGVVIVALQCESLWFNLRELLWIPADSVRQKLCSSPSDSRIQAKTPASAFQNPTSVQLQKHPAMLNRC